MGEPAKDQGAFRGYGLGFVHIAIPHLPQLQASDGERRERTLEQLLRGFNQACHAIACALPEMSCLGSSG